MSKKKPFAETENLLDMMIPTPQGWMPLGDATKAAVLWAMNRYLEKGERCKQG
jgi:hypothetical protein